MDLINKLKELLLINQSTKYIGGGKTLRDIYDVINDLQKNLPEKEKMDSYQIDNHNSSNCEISTMNIPKIGPYIEFFLEIQSNDYTDLKQILYRLNEVLRDINQIPFREQECGYIHSNFCYAFNENGIYLVTIDIIDKSYYYIITFFYFCYPTPEIIPRIILSTNSRILPIFNKPPLLYTSNKELSRKILMLQNKSVSTHKTRKLKTLLTPKYSSSKRKKTVRFRSTISPILSHSPKYSHIKDKTNYNFYPTLTYYGNQDSTIKNAVGFFITNDGKIILVWDRKKQSWSLPGGRRIQTDKTLQISLMREFTEETGIGLHNLRFKHDNISPIITTIIKHKHSNGNKTKTIVFVFKLKNNYKSLKKFFDKSRQFVGEKDYMTGLTLKELIKNTRNLHIDKFLEDTIEDLRQKGIIRDY